MAASAKGCSVRCQQEKRQLKRAFLNWSKNAVLLRGYECVLRTVLKPPLFHKVRDVFDVDCDFTEDWTPEAACNLCSARRDKEESRSSARIDQPDVVDSANPDEPLDLSVTKPGAVAAATTTASSSHKPVRQYSAVPSTTSSAAAAAALATARGSSAARPEFKVPFYNGAKPGSSGDSKKGYTSEDLTRAIEDIRSGRIGTRKASVLYGIPRSTLRNKICKIEGEPAASGSRSTTPVQRRLTDFFSALSAASRDDNHPPSIGNDPLAQWMGLNFLSSMNPWLYQHYLPNPFGLQEPVLASSQQNAATNDSLVNDSDDSPEHMKRNFAKSLSREHVTEFLNLMREKGPIPKVDLDKMSECWSEKHVRHLIDMAMCRGLEKSLGALHEKDSFFSNPSALSMLPLFFGAPWMTQPFPNSVREQGDLLFEQNASDDQQPAKKKPRVDSQKDKAPSPPKSASLSDSASASPRKVHIGPDGKQIRPKRGQYRRYENDQLMKAVEAVQRGEMSVHRAGTHFGVPHSTLEYKVKECRIKNGELSEDKWPAKNRKKGSDSKKSSVSPPSEMMPMLDKFLDDVAKSNASRSGSNESSTIAGDDPDEDLGRADCEDNETAGSHHSSMLSNENGEMISAVPVTNSGTVSSELLRRLQAKIQKKISEQR